jgi:uncharacterized membrane protein
MFTSRRKEHNAIEADTRIERPPSEVFAFCADLRNMPRYSGDVVAVDLVRSGVYRWVIQGPGGVRIRWTVKVTERHENTLMRYETAPFPGIRATWEFRFAPGGNPDETEVREVMSAPLGRASRAVLASMGKFPAEEVLANLRRLKQVMETGRVTDRSYAVAGRNFA